MSQDAIQLWHGSRKWSPPFEIRPPRKERSEHGYGIYFSNLITTARKYTKGGGICLRVEIDADLTLLDDVKLSIAEIRAFLHQCRMPLVYRSVILSRLDTHYREWQEIPANYLVNMCVDFGWSGKPAQNLVTWLVEKGIDASISDVGLHESYLILMNPKKIVSAVRVPTADIKWSEANFPTIKEQLKLIRNQQC